MNFDSEVQVLTYVDNVYSLFVLILSAPPLLTGNYLQL